MTQSQGPLADLRVVEMGQLLAGPICGQLLAGFGSIGEAMGGIRYVTGAPDKPPSRAVIHDANLLDLQAKYADVVPLESALAVLGG